MCEPWSLQGKKLWEYWELPVPEKLLRIFSVAGPIASLSVRGEPCRSRGDFDIAPRDALNPDQRVSAAGWPALVQDRPAEAIYGSSLQLFIIVVRTSPDLSEYPLVIIPVTGAREDAVLPHTPTLERSSSGLAHLLRLLSAPHLLLSPFPALLSAFFPDP